MVPSSLKTTSSREGAVKALGSQSGFAAASHPAGLWRDCQLLHGDIPWNHFCSLFQANKTLDEELLSPCIPGHSWVQCVRCKGLLNVLADEVLWIITHILIASGLWMAKVQGWGGAGGNWSQGSLQNSMPRVAPLCFGVISRGPKSDKRRWHHCPKTSPVPIPTAPLYWGEIPGKGIPGKGIPASCECSLQLCVWIPAGTHCPWALIDSSGQQSSQRMVWSQEKWKSNNLQSTHTCKFPCMATSFEEKLPSLAPEASPDSSWSCFCHWFRQLSPSTHKNAQISHPQKSLEIFKGPEISQIGRCETQILLVPTERERGRNPPDWSAHPSPSWAFLSSG